MSLSTLITLPFILWIAFDCKSPSFVRKLDAERRQSILPTEKDLKDGSMLEFDSGESFEKNGKNTEKSS